MLEVRLNSPWHLLVLYEPLDSNQSSVESELSCSLEPRCSWIGNGLEEVNFHSKRWRTALQKDESVGKQPLPLQIIRGRHTVLGSVRKPWKL
jgi:hypothetical protein